MVEESWGHVKYLIGSSPIKNIERKIWAKIQEMAGNLESWEMEKSVPKDLHFISNSCDPQFWAGNVLISNIPIDYVTRGPMSEQYIDKIRRAVSSQLPGARIMEESIEKLRSAKRNFILIQGT